MDRPDDLLEAAQPEHERRAEAAEALTGVDRREFLFVSLVTAAASTFGAGPALLAAQPPSRPAGAERQPAVPPFPLGNGEPPAEQFMPYAGGTGALMERLVRERGAAAFARGSFRVAPWTGPVPTSDEDLAFLPAHRLAALLKARKVTSTRLTRIYLDRLQRLNPTLLCAVTIMESQGLAEAARADAEIAAGRYRGPLHGLPYGVKDLFATKGVPTTWGARDFEGRVIDEDAEVVARLREAGAVLIAKLSTGLFAQNDQWFGGRTNNPWNLSQGSSGSSAGPGSATAAACVAFSIGTETQGSIVSPALRNGVSALRPTFGRVSRAGGMVLAWSQDRVGPMTRTVEDAAMVFHAIHGADPKDPSTVTTPFQYDPAIRLESLRIGVDPNAPKEFVDGLRALGMRPIAIGARPTVPGMGGGGLNVEYAAAFDDYVQRKAKEIGLDLNTVVTPTTGGAPFPGTSPMASAGTPMAPADWNPRFVNGRTVKAFEFLQSQRRRYVLVSRWAEFMKDLDMFVGAPTADVAPNAQTGHPCVVVPYKFDVPTPPGGPGGPPAGAAQPPAAATPLKPQPVGAVITGALYADDRILSVAHRFQASTDVHLKRPAIQ
ncbi:amidase [Roseisolibacter sp. H3M3-2]|uniref:amidase n=1 Tax=Roseisolibacter sp. H3M3-2 TaxID=3031323 RepID=UPI0023DAC70A|nr:amidase [Roseisolibacter sp. H3M3-2]MDF1504588.1 amidase [Roseisolibacter sp. H3M3-2]